ncbi:uncharacterized protein LY89DRAFT_670375 [Mollisia scopiformis]|uniref:Uncharacterized protein n=1 Tax=Mollisia scopiformis TaxID=149040 RepID=A0A194X6X3_MOLSC|nr:uncharacterized protein LY89DRAFT_670375 [Mollisia scopiformis]KUJ15834.1 hypothetical protein LY89DRAFT_670375 [Mollisia scopiformis]
MRFRIDLFALYLTLAVVHAQNQTVVDGCPKENYACLDVINSSQCIEELVIEKDAAITKDALEKCVDTEGAASNLTGAAKVGAETSHIKVGHVENTRLIKVWM